MRRTTSSARAHYRSSSCKKLAGCSKTLRHRDHMHISLTRAGGTRPDHWYAGRVRRADPR